VLYRELVQFEPLDTVVQLKEAAEVSEARRLVKTYVVSDRMVEQLAGLVFPQLRLDRGIDNKGIFIVGNYGTGKSHLMAVIGAVAEGAAYLPDLRNRAMQEKAAVFAGRYKVVRMELGAVTRRLYYIITDQLSAYLHSEGIEYTFPRLDDVGENKSGLVQAMHLFNAKFPEHGLLLIVDELLDYLRAQDAAGLNLDLGFLRELGEVTELAPFRFIAGVQESLYDSPTFAFFAQAVQRVRARFEQVRIAREDVAFVVQERLLAKTDAQIAWITEHLRQFSPLYPALADRLTEYARLFPIHPAYIEIFEQVYIAEKREVLKTLTAAIQTVLDKPVPDAETGLLSYDHYWGVILNDPSLRSQSGVISVVEKGTILRARVEGGYTRPALMAMALRMIDALCVQRLTTTDIRTPIGITADELRDKLCLWTSLPAQNRTARLLLDQVKTALREIMRTVSGQFITYNAENGQYFIDPEKDIDVDAKIEERSALVSSDQMQSFYYDALRQLFRNLPQSVYVPNYLIWAYELPWSDHKVTRPGYVFFGPPNKRSTAQPPRDFYMYFIAPFGTDAEGAASNQEDEVIFTLAGVDQEFANAMRSYAAARLLSVESTDLAAQYANKADGHLRKVRQWLERNLTTRLRIQHRNVAYSTPEVLAAMRSTASQDIEEMMRLMAAHLLEPCFAEAYPDYPRFTRLQAPVTEASRATSAMDAVRFLARGTRTQLGFGVADGLGLLDNNETLRPLDSPYARHLLEVLETRDAMQVVNAGEVIVQLAGGGTPVFKERRFRLEPEWVAVLLVALVADGRIELNLGGNHPALDAANVETAATISMTDLTNFRFYKRPRGVPIARWTMIFEGLGLQAALMRDENTRREGLRQLLERVQADLATVTTLLTTAEGILTIWGASLYTDHIQFAARAGEVETHSELAGVRLGQTDVVPYLRAAKQFLETLARYNTPGKLQNLALTELQISEGLAAYRKSQRIDDLVKLINQFQPLTAYLETAASNLADDDPWMPGAVQARQGLLDGLRTFAQNTASFPTPAFRQRLERLKRDYVKRYTELHNTYVLGQSADAARKRLLDSKQLKQARQLARIDLFSGSSELGGWSQALTAIPVCPNYHPGLIENTPTCPTCRFRAASAGAQPAQARLATLDARLETLLTQWHTALRSELGKETAQAAIATMTAAERKPITDYLALDEPAETTLPAGFVESVNQALRGLRGVTLNAAEVIAALKSPTMPCTVDDLERRFAAFVQALLAQGNDRNNTRLTIE